MAASIDDQQGDAILRSQFFDATVKGFATAMYKFKQSLNISSTSSWKNFFYREDPDTLVAPGAESFRDISRGANFPQASVEWQRIQKNIQKYGAEEFIYWEDIISNDVPIQERSLFRIAEAVTAAVDAQIWIDLGGAQYSSASAITSTAGIQAFNIGRDTTTPANFKPWNLSASAAIIDDLFRARQLIAEKNYDTANLEVWVSPRDLRSMMTWITDKGNQFSQFANDIAENGRVGKIAGIQVVVSNQVSASNALVVVPKICATWKELEPLQTTTIVDQYKGVKIRAVELGIVELTDPAACVLITGTQI